MQRPSLRTGALLAVAGLTLALGGAPLLASAADHLDAPALGTVSDSNGNFAPNSIHGDRDINDVYAFEGSNVSRTVLAMTTNPAIDLFGGSFGTNVRYIIRVDTNGNASPDIAYVWRFSALSGGAQDYTVTKYTGSNAGSLSSGTQIGSGNTGGTGIGSASGGASIFAGVRADPFFFDLTGFLGSVFHIGTDALGSDPHDFFLLRNTNAVVIEVPDSALGGGQVGVWGVTQWWDGSSWRAGDQMGRPAINTVFNNKYVDSNAGRAKNRFNHTPPSAQRTAYHGEFKKNIANTLQAINHVVLQDGCTDYDAATANAIANILLPDILTYDVSTPAVGPLNGRALGDDVIDAELALTTNNCAAASSDGIGPHTAQYLGVFPYLGVPH
jgi:hypothetical protein